MSIVKMKQLQLIAMAGDREELFRLLQRMGCVEISEAMQDPGEAGGPEGDLARELLNSLTRPESEKLAEARDRKNQADRALSLLKRSAPEKGGFLRARPGMGEAEFFEEEAFLRGREAARTIEEVDRRLRAIQAERSKLLSHKPILTPWAALDLPLETESTPHVTIQVGTLPAAGEFDAAAEAVAGAGDLARLELISSDREQHYCLLVCHTSQSEQVLELLRERGWSRTILREWQGTAAENLARIEKELSALAEEEARLEGQLAGMGGAASDLKRLSDRSAAEASREEAQSRRLETEKTFYLRGWVTEEKWPALEKALGDYPCAWEVRDPEPEEYPDVPVQLKNNWLTRPMNMVTEMYSLPAYGSVDPNPLMAPFFILFYGVMMADMGYGLLMMLASFFIMKKAKPKGPTMRHMIPLLGLCGVSTFIMGALTGGFFGDFLTQFMELLRPGSNFALPALITPLEDTLMILIGSMCLGVVHILTGMLVSFIRKIQKGQIMDAVWEEVTWWVVFAGIALMALGVTNLVLIAGLVLVVAGPLVTGKGIGKITGVFASLYNHITGYFGDILSYSRLMALMMAGSVIAQVFNTLGAIPGNVVVFLIIALVGNTLNFGLNLLGCYVHNMRLQCLEFFGKFYEDGGRPFRPLQFDTKYVDIQ